MNTWSPVAPSFRYERLSMRLARLAHDFLLIAMLSADEANEQVILEVIQESEILLDCTTIDLKVDAAFELAEMQRQLSQWHTHWAETWASDSGRLEISTSSHTWGNRVREMVETMF